MFIAMSRFEVANGLEDEVSRAFKNRPHKVDSVPGFIRMEVLRPQDEPAQFWLLTWWTDEASWDSWYHSHHYKDSHKGMPEGLKLVPDKTRIWKMERVAE
ncbi:MAG: antibiotic biosynthesis monooxygenase [Candidatus Sedimenticola sp. 20ELBAFRAG]